MSYPLDVELCSLMEDPTAGRIIHLLSHHAEAEIPEKRLKDVCQIVMSELPMVEFEVEEMDSYDSSSSQYTFDGSRSLSPPLAYSTTEGDSCGESDYGSDEGNIDASNQQGTQDKASPLQYDCASGSPANSQDGKVRRGKHVGKGDDQRDDSSPEMTLGLDIRLKKGDEAICYACPYRKRNPVVCNLRNHHECAIGFPDIERVLEHLGRCHLRVSDETANNEEATARRSSYTSDPELSMTSETFDSIKVHEGGTSNPRQKWESIWRCLFGQTDNILEPDFEAPIEAEEIVSEIRKSLRDFDAKVLREVDGLTSNTPESSGFAPLGALVTELWVRYLNSTFAKCERKVRGSSSIRLALPRRATTDVVSHWPRQSAFEAPSPGLTTRAKTFDCFRTLQPTVQCTPSGRDPAVSVVPKLAASSPSLEDYEASPTLTLSGSSVILNGSLNEEPTATSPNHQPAGQDIVQGFQEQDDADTSDSSSCSNEEDQDAGEQMEEDFVNEIISRVSSIILSMWTTNPSDFLIQEVQCSVESFAIELLNDIPFTDCPHEGEAASNTNSKSSCSSGSSRVTYSSSSRSRGTGTIRKRAQDEDSKEDGNEQGGRPPNSRSAAIHDEHSGLCCPFHIRNPTRFNSRAFPSCATKKWKKMTALKRHIRTFHLRKDSMPYLCQRCKEGFSTQESLTQHCEKENACKSVKSSSNKVENPEDGLSASGLMRLNKKTSREKIQSWQSLWRLLFPDDSVVPPCVFPPEIEGVARSFEAQQANLNQAIADAISPFIQDGPKAYDLTERLSVLVVQHVAGILGPYRGILSHSREAAKTAPSRRESDSPLSTASSPVEVNAEPAAKKRKSAHDRPASFGESSAQISATLAQNAPLVPSLDPDIADWTFLGTQLSNQAPVSYYQGNPSAFQSGMNHGSMNVMMHRPGYQPVPHSPYAMQQAYNHSLPNQNAMGVMNNKLNTSNNVRIGYCPRCRGNCPYPGHCLMSDQFNGS